MTKPIVKIKNVKFVDRGEYFSLSGEVENHPRFDAGERVTTSEIVRVETRNTIYEIEE